MTADRVVGAVGAGLALLLAALATQYWALGFDWTLDHVAYFASWTYPTVDGASTFPLVDHDRSMFHAHPWLGYAHVVFGPLALVLGAAQLWTGLRAARPRLHRAVGYAAIACQAIGLPCGMALGRYDYGGPVASYGFLGMGAATLACTAVALVAVLRGDVATHRRFMVRSYVAMWFGSVFFRVVVLDLLPLSGRMPDGFRAPYAAFTWLSWLLGLAAAEAWLVTSTGGGRGRPRLG